MLDDSAFLCCSSFLSQKGWYSTGDAINENSILIHDFYGREIQRPPVHLLVGTDLTKGFDNFLFSFWFFLLTSFVSRGVALAAYMGTSVALKDRPFGSHFSQIPLTLAVEGSDRAVLQAAASGNVASGQGQLLASLGQLSEMLTTLLAHARDEKGRDPAVGRALLGALGQHAQQLTDTAYDGALQDVLSVVTLGKLTRAQIQVCASLHALFTPTPKPVE